MLPGRAGMSPSMIGRTEALSRLAALISAPPIDRDDGLPAVGLVYGEAGVGKSRLLRELIAAASRAATVLLGQAEPTSLGRPHELVRDLLASAGTDAASLGLPHGDHPAADGSAGGVDAISARVGSGPALVVFEDLHWGDAESVATFEQLATRARLPRAVLIATVRPDELRRGLPCADMLLRLERRRTLCSVTLERLTRSEVGVFLASIFGRPMPSAVADALYGRTGGNPFFLEEILAGAGGIAPEQLASQPLPWTLEEVVRRQLDGISPDERRVVDAAAILGPSATFDVLSEVTGADERALIDVLRRLVGLGLVVETDVDSFAFRHALVRDAVVGQLLGRERRRLHEAALDALRRREPAAIADLARHAAGAGRFDEVVSLAREGVGHYLQRGSTYQALRLAADGLREAPDDLELLRGGTEAAWLVTLDEEALGYAQRWRSVAARQGRAEDEAAATRWEVRLLHETRRVEEMWAATEELMARAECLPSGIERARALAGVAQTYMLNGRPEEALAWAERAFAEADAVDAKVVRCQIMVEKGSALLGVAGRVDEGEALLQAAADDAEALGEYVTASRALSNWLGVLPWWAPNRRELAERLLAANSRAGFDAVGCMVTHVVNVGEAAASADRDEAERRLASSAQRSGRANRELPWVAYWEALFATEDGEADKAADILAASATLLPGVDEERWMHLRAALEVTALRRDGAAAVALAHEVAGLTAPPYENYAPELVVSTVDALLRAGVEPAEARTMLERELVPGRERIGELLPLAEGAIRAAEGDFAAAAELIAAGLDARHPSLPRYLGAHLRARLADALAHVGRLDEARAAAEAAVEELAHWPGWRHEAAEAQRRRTAASAASAGGSGDELTARERQIAELVAEGLSNGEVAARLYISPKTASVHVSNILAKLGLANRVEIAAWALNRRTEQR